MISTGVKLLVRAVVTGFGLSLGSAVFKKIQSRLGLADEASAKKEVEPEPTPPRDGTTDRLQH